MAHSKNSRPYTLITGCSSGIGKATCIHLHNRGYRVIATVRNPDDLDVLTEFGIPTYTVDLSQSMGITEPFRAIVEQHGTDIQALVNNGAYGQPGAVEDLRQSCVASMMNRY